MVKEVRLCDSCVFYVEETDSCKAFPEGVPLQGSETHFTPIPNQESDIVFQLDDEKLFWWESFLEIYPEVDIPDALRPPESVGEDDGTEEA